MLLVARSRGLLLALAVSCCCQLGPSPLRAGGVATCDLGPEEQSSPVDASLVLDLARLGAVEVEVSGELRVQRGDPADDGTIPVEILALDLRGDSDLGPVVIRRADAPPSTGAFLDPRPSPEEEVCGVDSFFDIWVEVSLREQQLSLTGAEPLRLVSIDAIPIKFIRPFPLELQNRGVSLVEATGAEVGSVRDLALQVRGRPCAPTSVDCAVRIGADGQPVVLVSWAFPASRPCRGNVVVSRIEADGSRTEFELPPDALRFEDRPPCDPLGSRTVRYCVRCVEREIASAERCCEVRIECPQDDCLRDLICERDPATGVVRLRWVADGPGADGTVCCEAFRILHDGVEVAILGADERDFVIDPCRPGQWCVQCVRPDGTFGRRLCCDVECPQVTPCIERIDCVRDPATGAVHIRWIVSGSPNEPCCEAFRILHDGVLVTTLGFDAREFVVDPCRSGTWCVQCIRIDGTLGEPICCEIRCDDPQPCLEDLRCERLADGSGIVLRWLVAGGNDVDCCGEFVITKDGVAIATLPGNERSYVVEPCESGTYCVECVKPDGTIERLCCEVECPRPEPCIEDVRCRVEDGRTIIEWLPLSDACCEAVEIWHEGTLVATVAPFPARWVLDGCRDGRWCVRCVRLDGTLGAFHCCRVSCPPRNLQLPGDCNQDATLDIGDVICLLRALFLGGSLPCSSPAGTTMLLDSNGDVTVDLSDALWVLNYLFLGGRPPVLGTRCIPIPTCPNVCP